MPYYRVWLGDGTEQYWVEADGEEEATKLVSLNVLKAKTKTNLVALSIPESRYQMFHNYCREVSARQDSLVLLQTSRYKRTAMWACTPPEDSSVEQTLGLALINYSPHSKIPLKRLGGLFRLKCLWLIGTANSNGARLQRFWNCALERYLQ